jgi:hypothetical protein
MKSEYSALSLAAAGTSAANCVLHTSATSRDEPFPPPLLQSVLPAVHYNKQTFAEEADRTF